MVSKKLETTCVFSQVPVYHHHGGIVSMKPRGSVCLTFEENVVVQVKMG